MHSRSQIVSPSTRKEHLEEPMDKRRKIAVGKMVGTNITNQLPRQVQLTVNAGPTTGGPSDAMPTATSDAGSCVGVEFSSREDVERLLSEKMNGKFKTDLKGKNEQMVEYTKKLKTCIKWLMEVEDGYLMELEKVRSSFECEEKRHLEMEIQMRINIEELNSRIEDLQGKYVSLQEKLSKEEDEKMAAIKSFREEAEARVASDNLRATLLEELERTMDDFKRNNDQMEKSAMMETIAGLRDHSNLLKNQLDSSRSSQQDAVKQKEELRKEVICLRSELQQVRDDRDVQLTLVQGLKLELADHKEFVGKTFEKLETIMTRTTDLEVMCSSQKEQIKLLECQLEAANEKIMRADATAIEVMTEYAQQKTLIKEMQNRIADADIQILEAEKLRRKLHNTILELKGNIRVFCRVRPAFPDNDCDAPEGAIVSYPTSFEFLGRAIDLMHHDQKYSFTFDKVFDHKASQEDVFVEISQLVQSALDGYKVCIFAYGQTGSGKTYTMMGQPEASLQKGLIPRSLEQIFQTSQSLQGQGWKYKMQASMLEIYNETIRDLLAPNRPSNIDASAAHGKQYTIKHVANGNAQVSDLTIVDVCSIKEVSYLLRQAAQSRSVGRTQMNEQSSRSHFVFTLRISGVNESTAQAVQGVLNLIDLAGSERLAKSGATGDRLKEAQAINKSLSSLSDVIFAIAKKEDHVPYRNSKLTYLLQPCLGGDSKTLMFVNISPEASSAGESICSLRFAARVNACEIGVPRRQAQMRSADSRLSCG